MRLTEFEPNWVTAEEGRSGMGLRLLCPHCRIEMLVAWFANPIDGGPPAPPSCTPAPRWQRLGDSFESLTLTPSIDASCCGHWHGFITNGEVR